MPSGRAKQTGFTYLLVLMMLAILGAASAAVLQIGATMERRAAEEELLAIGAEYQRALMSYRAAATTDLNRNPKSMADLLRDPRFPGVKRHLRKIYADPLTGRDTWGVYLDSNGSIAGVYSLASGAPIRKNGFVAPWERFKEAKTYSDWIFGF